METNLLLNDLLVKAGIDPETVIVLRHGPSERELNKVFGWILSEKPEFFEAYQSAHGVALEGALKLLTNKGYLASFIRHESGRALFAGLYRIGKSKTLTFDQYWQIPQNTELKNHGMVGFKGDRPSVQWFDLALTPHFSDWRGKLVIHWPPPDRSWWRRAHRNEMPVLAIHEESVLDAGMPPWDEIDLSWDSLSVFPASWKNKLSLWRGIYYIRDKSDGKGYVGSAYGESNLLGRWLNYAARGHGGNALLKARAPRNFQFTILELLSPTLPAEEVIRIETTWKNRLHSRNPDGLNEN